MLSVVAIIKAAVSKLSNIGGLRTGAVDLQRQFVSTAVCVAQSLLIASLPHTTNVYHGSYPSA